MNYLELKSRIVNAKALDFGDILGRCVDLFKKVWLHGFIVLLLNTILMIPLIIVAYVPLVFLAILDPESFAENSDPNIVVVFLSFILFVAVMLMSMAVSIALKAAYYRIARSKDLNLGHKEDYFYFLKRQYFKKMIILGIAIFAIVLLATLLCVLPIFYVMVPVYFIIVVFAFNPELSVSEIIKTAFDLGNKKWLITFGLLIVSYFLSTIVGVLLCFIGLYFTQQFIDLPAYFVYKESIGFDSSEEFNQIENQ